MPVSSSAVEEEGDGGASMGGGGAHPVRPSAPVDAIRSCMLISTVVGGAERPRLLCEAPEEAAFGHAPAGALSGGGGGGCPAKAAAATAACGVLFDLRGAKRSWEWRLDLRELDGGTNGVVSADFLKNSGLKAEDISASVRNLRNAA